MESTELSIEEMQGRAKILADVIDITYEKIKWTNRDDDERESGLMGKVYAVQIAIMCENGNRHINIGAARGTNHMDVIQTLIKNFNDNMMRFEMK